MLKYNKMLNLKELEEEVDNFIANETTESYNEMFRKSDFLDFKEKVRASGGYTTQFFCVERIVVSKPNLISGDFDFGDQNLNTAA